MENSEDILSPLPTKGTSSILAPDIHTIGLPDSRTKTTYWVMTAMAALIPESTVMMMALDDEIADYGFRSVNLHMYFSHLSLWQLY